MNFHNLNLLMKYAKEYGHNRIRVLGMSDTEHSICTLLFGHSDLSQDDVATNLRTDKTTVARALLTLEKKGYVKRHPNPRNRRKNLLYLTEKGKQSISEVVDVYDRWFDEVSSCLDKREQRQFDEYCARLLEASRKICEEK